MTSDAVIQSAVSVRQAATLLAGAIKSVEEIRKSRAASEIAIEALPEVVANAAKLDELLKQP